jgi:hypothetical protein
VVTFKIFQTKILNERGSIYLYFNYEQTTHHPAN